MKSLSVLELSKLYNINRQTIYNQINKGILSKNSDNKIDFQKPSVYLVNLQKTGCKRACKNRQSNFGRSFTA
jgi:predicted DNA-binding protein YlxM (UPF0122 family)